MTAKKIWISVLAVFAVIAIVCAGIGYSAWQTIDKRGGLKFILEEALSDVDAGIVTTIASASLEFKFSAAPLRLVAENIKLTAQDTSLSLPQSEFGFSIINLLTGSFVPSDMHMSGLEIEILHGKDGEGRDGWRAGPSMAVITALMRQNAVDAESNSALASIKNIYINDAKLIINRPKSEDLINEPEQITLEPISISMGHAGGRIKGSINVQNPNGGTVIVDFDGNEDGREITFSTVLSDIDMAMVYPYIGVTIPEIRDLGRLDGRLTMVVNGREIASLTGDLMIQDGKTTLPSFGAVSFSDASILFAYDAIKDLLTISNFDLATVRLNDDGSDIVAGNVNITGHVESPLSQQPAITAKLLGNNLPFEKLIAIWPEDSSPKFRERVMKTFRGGTVESLGLDIVGVLHREQYSFDASAIDIVTELRSVRFETGFASIENIVGSLGARLELSVESQGTINHASADIILQDAKLLAKNSGKIVDLENIALRAKLEGNTLTLTRGAINALSLGQMVVIGTVEIDQDWYPRRLDVNLQAEQIDKDFLVSLWPENIRPKTRAWIADRIHGGRINGLQMKVGIDIMPNAPPDVFYLDGKARVADARMTYAKGMSMITGLHAPVTFNKSFMQADIEAGQVSGIDIKGSQVIIKQDGKQAMVELAILSEGSFEGVVDILDGPRLGLFKRAGLNVTESSGEMNATVSMKWQIPGAGQTIKDVGGIDINVIGAVLGASMNGLPQGLSLTDADIDVIMADKVMTLSGRGKFDKAPGLISLSYDAAHNIDLEVKIPDSEAMTAIIRDALGIDILGSVGGVVSAKRRAGRDELNIETMFDFTETAINLERFGLAKQSGETATLKGMFKIAEGNLREIKELDLDSGFLSASGHASFDESGKFLNAFFDEISWSGNDISQITVERNTDDVLHISAEAKTIDLTLLRREESPSEGVSLEVDLTAEHIIVDERVSLSGNVALKTKKDGTGQATFLGSLFLNNKPYMTESTLTATFGGGDDVMEGRGLIGGAEASLSLNPSKQGGQSMVLRSSNAGQVLKTLNIIDAIRSGKLHMIAEFHPDEEGHAMINFELEDFRVIEAPTAVRMMSVLSLAGLYSLIEGDGTHFDEGRARIETFSDRQIIHQARASGSALAVDLVGVVKTKTRELEVSGALLPIYGITRLIGKVPILSEILTGTDNSGILVTQFTIDGTIDDPVTTINLSSIIPGVFRDVFSPDWINKERERLIGNGDNQTPEQ